MTMPAPRQPHPVRGAAFNVLRFASVLIGAGLLLRTASAEYVVSAPQQAPGRAPDTLSPAPRIAMPEPAFGKVAPAPAAVAHAKVRIAAIADAPSRSFGAAPGQGHALLPQATNEPELAKTIAQSAVPVAAPTLAAAPVATGHALAIAPRRSQPDPGLLAPVRVVSGAPVMRAPVAPVPSLPAESPVQISLAPPPMRPGARTTALTSDVHAEMRRPASAWDYAEALPPELTGRRSAAAPIEQAAPAIPASPAARPSDRVAAPRPQTDARAAPAAAPRALALLDRAPAPVRKERLHRKLALAPTRISPPAQAGAKAAPTRQLLADDQRNRLLGASSAAAAPDQRGSRKDGITTDDRVATLQEVSLQTAATGSSATLADAPDGSAPSGPMSLRDRMPRPAF